MANDTMATSTDVISELLQKLSELDHRVNEYRQDMAGEFRRYSAQVLKNRPREVTVQVQQAIAASAHKYPALISLPLETSTLLGGMDLDGSTGGSQCPQKARCASPPPALPHTSGTPPDSGARSPHEREAEFHGLFTPSYLPLLDAVQPHISLASPTTPPPPNPLVNNDPNRPKGGNDQPLAPPTSSSSLLPAPHPIATPAASSTENSNTNPAVPSRPNPQRRYTEDTVSSITSDDSSRVRRSALRRSSSSSTKTQSPRRVRFDVEGEEVLPTASPLLSPRTTDFAVSPLGNNGASASDGSFEKSQTGSTGDEDVSLLGSSPPRPKKITSTERLKAMARSSTEDTSQWTVVGNAYNVSDDEDDDLVLSLNGRSRKNLAPQHKDPEPISPVKSTPLDVVKELEEDADSEEEEEMLMMPALSSFKNKKKFSPPESSVRANNTSAPEPLPGGADHATVPKSAKADENITNSEVAEEDMFDLEDEDDGISTNGFRNKPRETSKYIEEGADEDVESVATDDRISDANSRGTLFSSSPAVSVPKPPVSEADSSTPPARTPVGSTVGSYRGKPFSMSSVRNDAIHEQASKMGDIYSFVGSVDGRSGVDDSNSYRPDVTPFNGTPRSFRERFMKEEQEEEERRKVLAK